MKVKTLLPLFLIGFGLSFLEPLRGDSLDDIDFFSVTDFDLHKIVPPPLSKASPKATGEIQEIIELQKNLTADQLTAIRNEDTLTASLFCTPLFSDLPNSDTSEITELLDLISDDVTKVADQGKTIWDAPSPAAIDNTVTTLVDIPSGPSYPESHSTLVYTWAGILVAIDPNKKEQIMARADQFTQDRVIAGVEFPSDSIGEKKLGAAIAQKLLKNPAFQTRLHAATGPLQIPATSAAPLPTTPASSVFGIQTAGNAAN